MQFIKNTLNKEGFKKGSVYLLLGLYFAICLITFNPYDPSFNRAAENEAANWGGILGAYIADPALQFFGLASILLATTFSIWSLRYFIRGQIKLISLRVAFLIIAIIATSLLLSLINTPEEWPFYVSLGGLFGDFLISKSSNLLGTTAIISISSFALFISLIIAWAISLQEIKLCLAALYKTTNIISKNTKKAFLYPLNLLINLKKEQIEEEEIEEKPTTQEKEAAQVVETKKKAKPAAKQVSMVFDEASSLPSSTLLAETVISNKQGVSEQALEQNARLLEKVLDEFGVKGKIIKVRPGPVVTLYELEPAAGTKSARVIGLADDIARSMSAISTRISVIPGRNAIGIELPNSSRETVYLRELIESDEYKDERVKLPIALGKDIGGENIIADLSRMPHLLIAGTTGSGKSVAINTMVLSFLYRMSPEECKFIMIDPKMLELSVYEGIPHLLSPVVTDPGKAVVALKWAVKEMENRYRLMSNLGVRNVAGYNKRIEEALSKNEKLERTVQTGFDPESGEPIFEKQELEMTKMPFIVVIVDEMADLMLVAGKDIEGSIQRLAQMARAAGIHLIMATQRPSVDVITGVIKANFPTRISFQVTSKVDSRTILGEQGAEQLLGMGDMLYMAGGSRITRVHGPFVDDKEVNKIVAFLKKQGKPGYVEDVTKADDEDSGSFDAPGDSGDELYDKAVNVVLNDKKVSTSYIQRQLRIGYNRAANIVERMEKEGLVSEPNHAGKREILVK